MTIDLLTFRELVRQLWRHILHLRARAQRASYHLRVPPTTDTDRVHLYKSKHDDDDDDAIKCLLGVAQ